MKAIQRALMWLVAVSAVALPVGAEPGQPASFSSAAGSVQSQLEASLAELAALQKQIAAEAIPMQRELAAAEAELIEVREAFKNTSRLLDSRTLDLTNLRNEIKARRDEAGYLSNLFREYGRNFESRLHIAEMQRYASDLERARQTPEDHGLDERAVYEAQIGLIERSLQRLDGLAGGDRFEGTAVDGSGRVVTGQFAMVGPSALFRSTDGEVVGTAEQRLGSLEPTVRPFEDPALAVIAARFVARDGDEMVFDPTLGNAHMIEQTRETLLEHVRKGGPVMYPIFGLAGAAFLVAFYKWVALTLVRKPSRRRIAALLEALRGGRKDEAVEAARRVGGPTGRMLSAGVAHIEEPRDLVEEIMYEQMLIARLKFQRFLPFVAISAAAAPLLGLLGTVTGIINTFKLITVFGTGDVKTLSGGISEALITTEFGLIVAIPSLLLHAFLSRKARAMGQQMEGAAIAMVNQLGKTPLARVPEAGRSGDRSEGAAGGSKPGGEGRPEVSAASAAAGEPAVDRADGPGDAAAVAGA